MFFRTTAAISIGVAALFALSGCSQGQQSNSQGGTAQQSGAPSSMPGSSPPTTSVPPTATQSATGATIYNGLTFAQLKAIFAAAQKPVFSEEPDSSGRGGSLRLNNGPLVSLTQCPEEDNGACYEIQIARTFSDVKPTTDAVNRWNFSTKVPEASVGADGTLHMEFWVTTVGLTDQLLLDSVGWFEGAWQQPESQEFWKPYMTGAGS